MESLVTTWGPFKVDFDKHTLCSRLMHWSLHRDTYEFDHWQAPVIKFADNWTSYAYATVIIFEMPPIEPIG